jgi:hypothetical protein
MGYGSTNFTSLQGPTTSQSSHRIQSWSTPLLQRRATCLPIFSVQLSEFRFPE